MTEQQQQDKVTGFRTIILLKDQTLGFGSYGSVCKAKCNDLLCAAKIIHPTLLDPTELHQIAPQREHRLPIRRFQLECEFLSTVRHPNIVQYLGTHQDPDTGLPVILMELTDESLTHFLESSIQPIPYHIQVNFCHDITLALSFLHSNGIIHRDLSSNNVLLIGNVRAKVTDFGMARLGDQNPQATQLTLTMCPGTDVYMPPEAVKDKPVYTEKIDCFSFGVITVQIVTRHSPEPGDRRKEIQFNQPGLPPIVQVPVPEIERRQNHIDEMDPNHPLKQIALDCLKDSDVERPSAQQLCERVVALKKDPQYHENVKGVEARSTAELDRSDERESSLRQQHSQQVFGLQKIIQSQTSRLVEKDQTIEQKEQIIVQNRQILREKDDTIAELREQTRQLEKEKGVVVEEKERELRQKADENDRLEMQLQRIKQQQEESEQIIAQFQKQIEQLRPATDISSNSKVQRNIIKLIWRRGKEAPYEMSNSYCAAVDGSTLYVRHATSHQMFMYNASTSCWSQLPDSPTEFCSTVIIDNLLTLVGGRDHSGGFSSQLFSLTGEGSGRRWTEEFPPMPTERAASATLCSGVALIVAGGWTFSGPTQTIELLNSETKQWSTAADLPQPLSFTPAAVCGDQLYVVGEIMYTCSVKLLLASIKSRSARVWKQVAAPPVTETTCVSVRDRLLAVGGSDSDWKPTSAVHMYNPTTDSWEVISHMGTPLKSCIAAILPNNQLMVVGGYISAHGATDSVEFALVK